MTHKRFNTVLTFGILMSALLFAQTASAADVRRFRTAENIYEVRAAYSSTPIEGELVTLGLWVEKRIADEAEEGVLMPVRDLEDSLEARILFGQDAIVVPLYDRGDGYGIDYIPRAGGEYTVRINGDIDGQDVSFDYVCEIERDVEVEMFEQGAEDEAAEEWLQIFGSGFIACPIASDSLSIPANSAEILAVHEQMRSLEDEVAQARAHAFDSRLFGIGGLLFGALGLFAGAGAMMRRRR